MGLEAYILIGGRSSRFGSDKAFAEFEGQSLAKRIADNINTALSPSRICFVAASEKQFDPALLQKLDHPVIFDLKPNFGTWSGLHAALTESQTEWIFVSACDLPFISSEFVKLLAACISSDYESVVPRQPDGRLQPLCAFYRVSSAQAVVDSFLDIDVRLPPLTVLFEKLKTYYLEPHTCLSLKNFDRIFLNINTLDDSRLLHSEQTESEAGIE